MCAPPLVCPLCASAGGFSSPGALWLGLIGVANRLLSCPICHELLLGLDKLTIHLVSHVPDLNLLASSIGNFVHSNQRVNNEAIMANYINFKDQGSNLINASSTRKKHCNPTMSGKNSEVSQQSNHQVHNCRASSLSGVIKPNDSISFETANFFNKSVLLERIAKAHGINGEADEKVKPSQTLSKNIPQELEKSATNSTDVKSTQTTKYNSGVDNSSSNMVMNISSSCCAGSPISVDNITTSNTSLLSDLLENKNACISQFKSDSHHLAANQANQTSSKRNILSLKSDQSQQQNESRTCFERINEWEKCDDAHVEQTRDTKLLQGISFYENKGAKKMFDPLRMTHNQPKCLQADDTIVCPSTNALDPSDENKVSQSVNNFPCQLCSRKLVSNGALIVHMRFAHSIVLGNLLDDDLERKLFAKESNPRIQVKEKNMATNSETQKSPEVIDQLQTENVKISGSNDNHILVEEPEEKPSTSISNTRGSFDERQNNSNDSPSIDNENSLDTNKEEHSNGSPPQPNGADEEAKHPCKVCDAQFGSIAELIAHRPVHIEDNGCICVVCGKTFKKEQHLQQHLRTHEGKQWECDVCSKFFTTKYFLKKHKRLHTGEMPYCCETCGKTFTFQQSYHKHLLYHSDEKPHVCGECGKRFKELSTLHNHERIHTGEKPFTCESCGKAFRQRVSYLVHRRIHTGVMPYKCTACDKSFRYKVSQRTHKCSSQQTGTVVRQSSDLVERLLSHQKDKSSPTECISEKCDAPFLSGNSEYLVISRSQIENKKLQHSPEFHSSRGKTDSFEVNSNSLPSQSDRIFLPNNQNLIDSYTMQHPENLSSGQSSLQKNSQNFSDVLPCNDIKASAFDYSVGVHPRDDKGKTLERCSLEPGKKQIGISRQELNINCFPGATGAGILLTDNSANKLHHNQDLNFKEINSKVMATKVHDSTSVREIFDSSIFSNSVQMLTPSEEDFFTLVIPPADPALEKLGKLSISSIPSSPANINPGLNYQNSHNKERMVEKTNEINAASKEIPSSMDQLNVNLKSSNFTTLDNTVFSRDNENAANASDLSSFLQSCLEQWHPSNFTTNDKPKDQITIPDPACTDSNKVNPSELIDTRLHTINEESLKRLLYGDSVP